MTRRGSRSTTTHVQRVQNMPPLYSDPEKERDFLMRRHQMLRRAAGFMLAKKYRTPWYASPSAPHSDARMPKTARRSKNTNRSKPVGPTATTPSPPGTLGVLSKLRGYTREELINFWKDLPPVAKRALLRIHRDVYLAALDQYLVRQNLCCECHDNVIAEWEDLERRRSGSRSLQDVFSVFPPFLDDEDEDDDEEEEEDDEEDDDEECDDDVECDDDDHQCRHRRHDLDDDDDDLLENDNELIDEDDDEVVFDYELEGDPFTRVARRTGPPPRGPPADDVFLSDEYLAALEVGKRQEQEYLAALEVGKRQEDELLRLIQKEERYIIIREDHSEFIMDLIRCGEQFSSYMAALRPLPAYDDALHNYDEDDEDEDDEDDDAECPGANTSHLAQEYLLEVLAVKFREQLESAYQAALQHSLAVQAELLREEIAELQRDQKQQQQQATTTTSSSKNKKKKDKKKKKKKSETTTTASRAGNTNQTSGLKDGRTRRATDNQNESGSTTETSPAKTAASRRMRSSSAPVGTNKKPRSNQLEDEPRAPNNQEDNDNDEDDDHGDSLDEGDGPEVDAVDREVEEFRLLLEKINAQQQPRKAKPKLVLPPGAFRCMV